MAALRALIVLCILQSVISAVAEANLKTNLRPYAARHQAAPSASHQDVAHAAASPIVRSDVAQGFRHLGVHLAAAPAVPVASQAQDDDDDDDNDENVAPSAKLPKLPLPKVAAPSAKLPKVKKMKKLAVKAESAAKPLPAVAEPIAAYVLPRVVAGAASTPAQVAAAPPQFAALKQLNDDLVEVRQMHTNVMTVEKTLAADVHLLRESAKLQKMSTSAKARKSALQQVRQTEKLVKDTEAMVVQSRVNAVARAREALHEARLVQKAADALSDEAQAQLRGTESAAAEVGEAKHVAPRTSAKIQAPTQKAIAAKPTDDDDDANSVANSVADDVAM